MLKQTATYILKNDLGGITSLIKNLIEYRGANALPPEVIFINIEDGNTRYPEHFVPKVPISMLKYSQKNNWYHSFKKLKELTGNGSGVLISNDSYDLIMVTYYNINKKIIQIVHDAYNIKLSIQFEEVIDCFVCHSWFYYEMLCQLISHRRKDIFFINYGIPILYSSKELSTRNYLNLVFIGRHHTGKGIYDLYKIDELLKKNNIPVKWLILGAGPESEGLKKQWIDKDNVTFYTAKNSQEIIELCHDMDVFVFPTKFEGFPVAMVEAMSVGCIPVVSDLPGGVRELSDNGNNAFLCPVDDNIRFADAIIELYNNEALKKTMRKNCEVFTSTRHNSSFQSPKYQELFLKIANQPSMPLHNSVKKKLGSRLDQPFIPNFITRFLREYTV